jgi:hypothetical protein
MAPAKPARQKQTATGVSARKARSSSRLQGQDLRRAMEELCDAKSDRGAQQLKRIIADSICDA